MAKKWIKRGLKYVTPVLLIAVSVHFTFGKKSPLDIDQLLATPLHYVVYKTSEPLQIDGKPTEKAWQKAQWSSWFVDIEGDKKPEPAYKTRFKMLWDDEALYIFAELEEPHIWATLTGHDQVVYHDNDFEVFIDPDGDTHQYFEIEVNALGTVFDLFMTKPYRNGSQALISWNAGNLQVGVDIDGTINDPSDIDNKWCVEMAIPFRDVSIGNSVQAPKEGAFWRINFSRVQWITEIEGNSYRKKINPATGKPHSEHNWVWSPQGIVDMHYPERWGYAFFSAIEVGTGVVHLELPEDELLKSHLWKVYYLQDRYRRRNGRYAKDFRELKLDPKVIHNGDQCTLSMEALSFPAGRGGQYTAALHCEKAGKVYQINQEGHIQIFMSKENQ